MNIDYSGVAENLKSDLKKAIDKNKRTEEQANKTSELKKCPFCGGKAKLIKEVRVNLYAVQCKGCGCMTPYQFDFGEGGEVSKKKAIQVWNNRKPVDRATERLVEERRKEGDSMGNHCCGCGYDAFTDAIAIIKELM